MGNRPGLLKGDLDSYNSTWLLSDYTESIVTNGRDVLDSGSTIPAVKQMHLELKKLWRAPCMCFCLCICVLYVHVCEGLCMCFQVNEDAKGEHKNTSLRGGELERWLRD